MVSINWRNAITEFWQTYMLTFVICMVRGDAFVTSAALYGVIVGTGNISGTHINPAVTVAFIIMEAGQKIYSNIPTYLVYVPCQFIGAVLGGFIAYGLLGQTLSLHVSEDHSIGQAFVVELLGTYFLAYVIISCGEHCAGHLSPSLACSSVLFVILKGPGFVSGPGYNPAIALGLDLPDAANHGVDHLDDMWIYFIPSMIGGVFAGLWWHFMIPGFRAKWKTDEIEPITGGVTKGRESELELHDVIPLSKEV